jgi:zinc/manganese transport system substrate-binding protein
VDASQGDVHPEGNPHYWLDPRNGAAVARWLAERFASLRPVHEDLYRANAESFAREIESRLPRWRERLEGARFVEYHRSWIYLSERFDLEIVGQVEPLPGIPPSARHLARLAETVRARGVRVVVRDTYHPASPVEFLERETDVTTAILPSSCDEPAPESYLAHFDRVADILGGWRAAAPERAAAGEQP